MMMIMGFELLLGSEKEMIRVDVKWRQRRKVSVRMLFWIPYGKNVITKENHLLTKEGHVFLTWCVKADDDFTSLGNNSHIQIDLCI